jgi:hypothetical protein
MQGEHPDIDDDGYIPNPVTDLVLPEKDQQEQVVKDKYGDWDQGPGSLTDLSLGIHYPDQGKDQYNQQPPEPQGDPLSTYAPVTVKVLQDLGICRKGSFHRMVQSVTGCQNVNKLDS